MDGGSGRGGGLKSLTGAPQDWWGFAKLKGKTSEGHCLESQTREKSIGPRAQEGVGNLRSF